MKSNHKLWIVTDYMGYSVNNNNQKIHMDGIQRM